MSENHPTSPLRFSRRTFLNRGTALGALAAGLPLGWVGGAYADGSP